MVGKGLLMQEMNIDGTPSDNQMNEHIGRLTGRGGPFELTSVEGEPPRFRRGAGNLSSLFNRVKLLHNRIQLRHIQDFTFGDVARWSSDLVGPDSHGQCYLGIRDDDPLTWMAEFMFAVSNGNVAVPIGGADHVEAFGLHTQHTLFLGGLVKAISSNSNASAFRSSASPNATASEDGGRRPAIVLFTSGTSGLPKPVFHSHEGVLSGLSNMLLAGSISALSCGGAAPTQNRASSVLLMCPLSYIAGTAQFLLSFLLGSSIAVPVDRSPHGLASIIQQSQITSIVGISRDQLTQLIDLPGIEQLAASLRTIHIYGETLPASQVCALRKILPDARIGQGYGMTEAFGPIAGFLREDAEGPLFWKLPSLEAAVMYGSELRSHGSGRLHIRGRNMMLGYGSPQNPSAPFDWFDTGDEVELSCSGKMRILDRGSRVLTSVGAGRTYLAHIERRALQWNARDAIAWISTKLGSPVVYLAVIPNTEVKSDLESILTAEFGIKVRILHVSFIPRRHGGKIDRDELVRMETAVEDALCE